MTIEKYFHILEHFNEHTAVIGRKQEKRKSVTNMTSSSGGEEPPKVQIKNGHHMERTKLTDWKKLAKSKKAGETTEKRQKTSSNGQFK